MEGYLNDYAKTLEETKSSGSAKEHQESYIQLRDYYSSQVYFDDLDLSNQADFPQIYHVVSCLKMPSMICWTSIFQMGSNSWRSQRKCKNGEIIIYILSFLR